MSAHKALADMIKATAPCERPGFPAGRAVRLQTPMPWPPEEHLGFKILPARTG
ncbi:hypothetical protein AB0451_38200 [Streptomyces sp. NPDC052000]|uniref:hypothetical protein n=1 Tax=Streptomyces sp. NPDC052000 TaxID=3155676 RepID=UPI00344F3198